MESSSTELVVYVPASPQMAAQLGIAAGSGIVGSPVSPGGRVMVDFEGNLYGAANIVTFADRVRHAADRHATGYPTVARRFVPAESLTAIGSYHAGRVELHDDGEQQLMSWLADDADISAQLRTSG